MERIDTVDKTRCTGCTACMDACRTGAISMKEDENGFLFPYIDEKRCIHCKFCSIICSEGNAYAGNLLGKQPLFAYAMKHRDEEIHRTSQSGGVFYALAQAVIRAGGVVFGAAFLEDFSVAHICVEKESDLYRLQGSKYVQSDMNSVISQVKQLLKQNKLVLFSGTPCQCTGVRCACRGYEDTLLLVDLICHGVPARKLWKDFLNYSSRKYHGKITKAEFRISDGSGKGHVERITVNGKRYTSTTYGQLFYSHAFFRESCDHCKFRTAGRVGDITLGDWIYGQRSEDVFWERTGVSQVLVNTEKGVLWLERIRDSFEVRSLEWKECTQPALEDEYYCNLNKKEILEIYRQKGFSVIARRYGHENRAIKFKRRLKKLGGFLGKHFGIRQT
ncbi:MAG: Coenzyme F420 hydrogenase/dehydrogenase, beta subunit C-terminal domain [Lachnospiraceae bacterium]|nr:Coenzyme F420 hydrogenase/dehydrogenase, beta subunit C-terminal domain [Lachnospiraceae bacterium]